jgi:hypothetical protein
MIRKLSKRSYRVLALSGTLTLLVALLVAVTAQAQTTAIQGGLVSSMDSGYETTGDGKTFKNNKHGTFVAMRANDSTFEVQTRRDHHGRHFRKVYNVAVGVKANEEGDRVIYDVKPDQLTFNGSPYPISDGEGVVIPNGGQIDRLSNVYTVTSESGDKVTLTVQRKWVDVKIEAAVSRQGGDMKGSLGHLDSDLDPNNDLVNRNGNVVTDVTQFLKGWRVLQGESMFG